MKRILTITLFTSFLFSFATGQSLLKKKNELFRTDHASARSRSVFSYTLTTFSDPYNDLTGATSINNGEVWDEPDYIVPIPFPFALLGTDVTYLEFYGSGSLMRAPTEDPDVDAYVFPFETDLVDRGSFGAVSLSPISYKSTGTAGNHILKIEFKNVGSYYEMDENGTLDMFINFQLWLFEGSNKIEFHFGNSSINDPSVFYGGDIGAGLGVANYNETDDIISNPHFLVGQPSNPTLSANVSFLNGTPSNGTVYRLSLQSPLDVDVTGQNGNSFCNPNGTATATASGGTEPYTYHWNNGATTSTIINLGGGTYTVTVTDASAMTATGSTTITIPNPIEVNASSTDETSVNANDGTAIAVPTEGLPPFGWLWSNGSAGFQIVDLAPGIYTVTITDDAGCTASESVVVNAFGCPPLEIISSLVDISCNGLCDGNIQINDVDQGVSPFTFMWSNGSASAFINNLCTGDYDVTVTDANGCIVNATYHITEPPQLLVSTGSTTETGPGAGDGTAWAIPVGGTTPYAYAWSNGGVDSLITGLVPGTYAVTVTDGNMCSTTNTAVVNIFSCTTVEGVIVNNSCFESCDGSISVTLNNAVLPVTYLWDDGSTTSTLADLCAGPYGVTVSDATGCSASGVFIVNQPGQLFANVSSTDETASGANDGTARATPFGGAPPYTYMWSNGSMDSLISNLIPDIYTVIVTDANGCQDSQDIQVNSFVCQGFVEAFFRNESCADSCQWGGTAVVIGGLGEYTFLWETGDTTSTISGFCPGIHELTVVDVGQNCSHFDIFNFIPEEIIGAVDEVVHLTDSTTTAINITVISGTPIFHYTWSGPNGFTSQDQDLAGIAPGFYSVEILGPFGCGRIDSIEVLDHTVGIFIPGDLEAKIYPNPATNQITIDLDMETGYEVQIYSADGHVIHTWNDVKTINVGDIAAGIYAIKVTSGEKYYVQRLVIGR